MRLLRLFFGVVILSGCNTLNNEYTDEIEKAQRFGVDFSETAIVQLISVDGEGAFAGISKVNGDPLDCRESGCPVWVRVLPGDHTLSLDKVQSDWRMSPTHFAGLERIEVQLENLKAGHIYSLAVYKQALEQYGYKYHDVGFYPDNYPFLQILGVAHANTRLY